MAIANTRILTAAFEYLTPGTIEEAVELLARYGPDARPIAGGTDLLVQMKKEAISPAYLVDVMKIPALGFIRADDGWLRIGAATKWSEILRFSAMDTRHAALYEAVRSLGKVQVRNMGTIGGNLCTASPAADSAPPLLVFESEVRLLGVDGERTLELVDFFKGVNETVMAPGEIMTEILIPPASPGSGSAFIKIGRVGGDISKVSCAIALERRKDHCVSCRIAMGAVGPVPLRVGAAERIVEDMKVDHSRVEEVGRRAGEAIRPITDIRSTAQYRRALASVLVQDVFWAAWHRAGGGE